MNRLSTIKNMVEHLFKLNGNARIIILDNNSTYEPLLKWYNEIKNDVKVILQGRNNGPWTFFYSYHSQNEKSQIYVYTDGDLELNPNMPCYWQEVLLYYLLKYKRKSSLALKISDLPDNHIKQDIIGHQNQSWIPTEEKDVYLAITDMTFSMDKRANGYRFESIRLAGNFECRHIPWYVDSNNITEEEKYYLNNINELYTDAIWSIRNKQKFLQEL